MINIRYQLHILFYIGPSYSVGVYLWVVAGRPQRGSLVVIVGVVVIVIVVIVVVVDDGG